MRVLYVIDSLAPGGAERSLVALAPRYATRGIELEVAYLHDRVGLQDELEESGAMLHCLAGAGGRLGWLRRTDRLVRQRHPDVVHTTLFEADVAGRVAATLRRRPLVSSLVNVAYGPEMLSDPRLRRWKVRGAQLVDGATAQLVRRFHAVSDHVAHVMAERLHIPRRRIDVVPRGRDPAELGSRTPDRRARTRAALGLSGEAAVILVVARQERQKGIDVVLEAMPRILDRIPNARLLVAGREGNDTPRLVSTVDRLRLGDAVRFLGVRTDVGDLLAGTDTFVLPSRWEGFPGAVLEAMALEAPIVASDLPMVREAVGDDRAAWLVASGRPDTLAEAVIVSLTAPDAAGARTSAALERFRAMFTIDRVADRMVAFYHRALEGDAH
jgi:glycosyltransferase involved in cell wall biosynthesis